jgi:hypothetical protein
MEVPVTYLGQPVPGVMALIEQLPNGDYGLTFNHVIQRMAQIEARIRQQFGLGQNQHVTPETINPLGVDYRLAVPLAGAQPVANENVQAAMQELLQALAAGGGAGAAGAGNMYANAPHIGELAVPAEAQAPIGLNIPAAGTEMVNFHGEHGLGRIYTREEFDHLPIKAHGRKENPSTRQPIQPGNVRYYRLSGGKKRRGTKHRGTKRRGRGRRSRTHKRN